MNMGSCKFLILVSTHLAGMAVPPQHCTIFVHRHARFASGHCMGDDEHDSRSTYPDACGALSVGASIMRVFDEESGIAHAAFNESWEHSLAKVRRLRCQNV